MRKQLHIIVQGKVQGVYFRNFTRREAEKYALTGWVRNLANGEVEILLQGDIEALEKIKQWCWQGSPHSKVNNVLIKDEIKEFSESFSSFQIRH